MADSLSISSVGSAGLTPISPLTLRQATTDALPSPASTTTSASSIVSLSQQGQLLASQAQQTPQTTVTPTTSDVEVANSRTQSAQTALQNLLTDPQRVVLRNILDPYFSSLVASVRMNELNVQSPIIDPRLLATDSPAAVSRIPAYRAIGYYREGADLA